MVLSLPSAQTRTMASDPGDLSWLDDLRSGAWMQDADWLFVSGYVLLRTPDPQRVVETVAVARAHGTRIALDLSSAAMIARYGADAFSALCVSLRPSVVFATDAEWATTADGFEAGDASVLVLKHGGRGATFVVEGEADERAVLPGPVVDATGAGDALAAGLPRRRRRPGDGDRRPVRRPARRPARRCGGRSVTGAPSGSLGGPLSVRGVEIPASDLAWRFSRSSGPGGQSVNTADSRVELTFDVERSGVLPERMRERLLARLGHRLVDGRLTVAASEYRSQHRNREAARARLADLLTEASAPPPPRRRATRPTRGSQERRLAGKKQRGQTKAMRRRPVD